MEKHIYVDKELKYYHNKDIPSTGKALCPICGSWDTKWTGNAMHFDYNCLTFLQCRECGAESTISWTRPRAAAAYVNE